VAFICAATFRFPKEFKIPAASLLETRRYDFDEQLVVESEAEEAQLRQDLEESISLRIVRKLSSVTDFQPGT